MAKTANISRKRQNLRGSACRARQVSSQTVLIRRWRLQNVQIKEGEIYLRYAVDGVLDLGDDVKRADLAQVHQQTNPPESLSAGERSLVYIPLDAQLSLHRQGSFRAL